jgi:hypothetical protein
MKALILILALASSASASEKLIPALIAVESSGQNNLIGDHGKAYGCLQIHQEVVNDVNRLYHLRYTHNDCFNRDVSIRICQLYLKHYANNRSDEDSARIWNGGPLGYKKSATIKYWNRVKQFIK